MRKIARELGIDLTRVKGSEAGGRINLGDRARLHPALAADRVSQHGSTTAQPALQQPPADAKRSRSISPNGVRFAGKRCRRCGAPSAAAWWSLGRRFPKINQFADADITASAGAAQKTCAAYEKKGAHLTLTSFFCWCLAARLKKHPRANASMDEAAHEIVYKDYCHIGVAVDTEGGLIVPILRDVDRKIFLSFPRSCTRSRKKPANARFLSRSCKAARLRFPTRAASAAAILRRSSTRPRWRFWASAKGKPKPVAIDGKDRHPNDAAALSRLRSPRARRRRRRALFKRRHHRTRSIR